MEMEQTMERLLAEIRTNQAKLILSPPKWM
jgi:hypothetical protein